MKIQCECPCGNPKTVELKDGYIDDWTCPVCGSLNGDVFMARLEKCDVELIPTDKNYKVYISNQGGEDFKQTYGHKDEQGNHQWICRSIDQIKFYFYHLSDAQKERFVELFNQRKLKVGYPGHFYSMPYFMKVIK